MITYSTKFPVKEKFDKKTFVEMVLKWNQGSKYDKFNSLEWDGENYSTFWEEDGKKLFIEELSSEGVVASRYQKEDEHGVWKTDFILNCNRAYITVKVVLETTEFTTDFSPNYYPPFFVKQIIYWQYAGEDGGIPVDQNAHSLDVHFDNIKEFVTGGTSLALPIVLISKKSEGDYPVDLSTLAFKLQGVAHLIYEDKDVDFEDYTSKLDCDAKNGTAIIAYPNKNMKRKVINLLGVSNENPEQIMSRIISAVYEFSNQVMRLDVDTWEGIQNERLHLQNGILISDRKSLETENAEIYEVFEEQLSKTESVNQDLSREIQRLTIENQALRMKLASRDQQPLIYMGEEVDFYEGEIREIILEILEDYSRNVQKDTRREHIITDLLENNVYEHIPAKRREQIKVAMKGYKSLRGSLRSLLESMGFVISDDGKHYKWTYFGDHRYSATVAKTSSDSRAGMNMALLIDNLMF